MRDVIKTASQYLFYLLAGVILLWTASLTLSLVGRLLPGDPLTPLFSMALFDGGALVWALVFLFKAQGLAQRAISLMLMIFDLAGVGLMSMGELFLGGQDLASIPAGLGTAIVWAVGIWTIANVVAIYAFHIVDPAEMSEIRIRSMQDKIEAQALDQAEAMANENAYALASQISATNYATLLARLRLPSASAAQVIDVQAHDVTDTGTGTPMVQYAAETETPEVTDIGNLDPTPPAKRRTLKR